MKDFQNETIAIIKITDSYGNYKIFIVIKSLFIKQIMKIKLLIIKSIIIMKINSNTIKSISYKKFIKRNLLNKTLTMITKKINFIIKLMLISLIFISFVAIALRFSIRNRNFISIWEKVICLRL